MYRVFVAHPYKVRSFRTSDYRAAIATAFSGVASASYADDDVGEEHILHKIRRQIKEADLCLFDLSGNNRNVILELGIAMGETKPYRLLAKVDTPSATAKFITDLVGWDRIQYQSLPSLIAELNEKVALVFKPGQLAGRIVSKEIDTSILPFLHVDYKLVNDALISGTVQNIGSGAAIHGKVKLPGLDLIDIGAPLMVNQSLSFSLPLHVSELKDGKGTPRALAEFQDKAGTIYQQTASIPNPFYKGRFMDYILESFDPPTVVKAFEL